MSAFKWGFRVVGGKDMERLSTNWWRAFRAYANADEQARCDEEAYLSHFIFDGEFADYLRQRRTVRGLPSSTPCFADWLWWDIDREGDLYAARKDTAELILTLAGEFAILVEDLLLFFSGSKGFHVGLSTGLWLCEPSADFNLVARAFCEAAAAKAKVHIDSGIYDKVRLFRAPNSRHPKTGLYKTGLTFDELVHAPDEAILRRAQSPRPFSIPDPKGSDWNLQNAWNDAAKEVRERATALAARPNTAPKLNQLTIDFIRRGANVGGGPDDRETGDGRHRRLFSAAANLAEFNCPPALAHALLTEPGLDCGLAPAEVRRQIDCGLEHVQRGGQR